MVYYNPHIAGWHYPLYNLNNQDQAFFCLSSYFDVQPFVFNGVKLVSLDDFQPRRLEQKQLTTVENVDATLKGKHSNENQPTPQKETTFKVGPVSSFSIYKVAITQVPHL